LTRPLFRFHLLTLAFFALVALIALYNPIIHIPNFVPGTQPIDYYHFHWNYWWIRHVINTPGLNIYETNYVFAPATSSLVYHTLTVFWFPVWALFEPLVGTVAAMTVIFALIFTLNGYLFFRLLGSLGALTGLALAGGLMLELMPIMFVSLGLTNINTMSWFWLPLMLMLWGKVVPIVTHVWGGGWRQQNGIFWALIFGVALWLMMLTDLQLPLFLAFLIIPYGVWTLWTVGNGWRGRLHLAGLGVLSLAVALVLLWFAGPLPYILDFDPTGLSPTPAERAVSIAFPLGYVWRLADDPSVGAVLIPAFGLAVFIYVRRTLKASGYSKEKPAEADSKTPYSALVPFSGLPINLARGFEPLADISPPKTLWLLLIPLPLILSAGAFITLGGAQMPMPYLAFHALFGGMFRYPERFAPVFLIPMVIFTALVLTDALRNRPALYRALTVAGIALILLDVRIFQPVPVQPVPNPYQTYEMMGREPYDYVVVDVPTAGSSGEGIVGEPIFITTQWYGMTHGKRMVNGHISRVNVERYWYMRTDDPMMAWLGQRRYIEPETVREQMRERIFDWPIGYFVIHHSWIEQNGPTLQEVLGFFNAQTDLMCHVATEDDITVYRTAAHPDGCPATQNIPPEIEPGVYQIDIGSPGDEAYIGWGWHRAEDVGGLTLRWLGEYPQTQTYLDLPPGEYELTLSAQAYQERREVRVLLNRVVLKSTNPTPTVGVPSPNSGRGGGEGSKSIPPDSLQPYTFNVPAEVVGSGENLTLTIEYDDALSPQEIGQGDDPRELAIAVDWLRFTRVD
jgi:hypothetical protein